MFHVRGDGFAHTAQVAIDQGDGRYTVQLDGNRVVFTAFVDAQEVHVWCGAKHHSFALPPPAWAASSASAVSSGSLVAPMPGRITRILAKVGQTVKAGEALLTMEAMKMETIVRAPADGVVKSIALNVGDLCAGGQVLAVVEEPK